ncbi:hypothetical protein GCM10009616_33980 [Microlunatus lacustris]
MEMTSHLVDFLPFEVADYLESRAFAASSMLVTGPAGSGKSPLLTALANATGDHLMLAGLSDLRATLPCLYDHGRALSLHVPRILEMPGTDLVHVLTRQSVHVAIADDPSDQTWSVLSDLVTAGISVWASTTATRRIPADLVLQLDRSSGLVGSIHDGQRRLIYQAGHTGTAVFNPGA